MDKTLHFYHHWLGLELLRTSAANPEGGRTAVLKLGRQEINIFSRPDINVRATKQWRVNPPFMPY